MRASVAGSLILSLLVGCNAILGNESGVFVGENGGSSGTGTSQGGGPSNGGAHQSGGTAGKGPGGTAGSAATGGAGTSEGGADSGSGGDTSSETGGMLGAGGMMGFGGSSSTGGSTLTGGSNSTGSSSSTGGTSAGGAKASGGATSGGSSSGGTQATGGSGTGGATSGGTKATGGASTGGTAAGGAKATGGSTTGGTASGGTTGGTKSTGGTSTGGTSTGGTSTGGTTGGTSTGGTSTGGTTGGTSTGGTSTGGSPPIVGPCDIYASASTPCVAAYSTTRVLSGSYAGSLYQVRKGGDRAGTGGLLKDIGVVAGGYADGPAQDVFCGTDTCTISKLYDQSGKGNDLTVAPAGCSTSGGMYAALPDYEADAKKRSVTLNGHTAYALSTIAREAYRRNTTTGMPLGTAAQGIYEVADGQNVGSQCCFDFGNVSTDNCFSSTPSSLFFGTAYWGNGNGTGPWFMADFEAGIWAGGSLPGQPGWGELGAGTFPPNPNNPSVKIPFAFGILKTNPSGYAIRVGNAQSGTLTTAYDGALPKTLNMKGGIVLGVAQDNSNNSFGTFFEGAITSGRPSDATDAAVHANVIAAGYGK